MKHRLMVIGVILWLAACGGPPPMPLPAGATPTLEPAAATSTPTSATIPTMTPTPIPVPTAKATPTAVAGPLDDRAWLAWTVAPDGAVFALDATYTVYQLSPDNVSPLARSAPLFEATGEAPAYLLAGETQLFVGSAAVTQTLVLNRSDARNSGASFFSQAARLDQAGPMALDPGKRLFMIPLSAAWPPFKSAFWAYDLSDLSRPAAEVQLSCVSAQDLVADPVARHLVVRLHSACSSPPHQREAYAIYDLDTLQELGSSNPELGILTRPAIVGRSGAIVGGLYALNGVDHKLFILDRQGQEIKSYSPLDGKPATDAAGNWIYLLRRRGLWVVRAEDLSLQSTLPFTQTPPTDLMLSPDGETLYLFGNGWRTALRTAELRSMGIPPISPFPTAWINDDWMEYAQPRLYLSPHMGEDGLAFVQLVDGIGDARETYRTTDGGRSWRLFWAPTYPGFKKIHCLSLSPDFARDRTLTAFAWSSTLRSTDGGATWESWQPRIAFVSDRDGNREIYTMDQAGGTVQRLTDRPAAEENPAWSPAETRLAFQGNRNGNWDIFTMRADCDPAGPQAEQRCDLRQVTADPADDMLPAWSPDGRSIAFVSTRDGNPEIYVMDSDGHHQRRLTINPTGDWRPAWLPDSQHLLFVSDRGGNNDIYQLTVPPADAAPLAAEPELTPVVTSPADDRDPAVSFDGQLLFLSDRDGVMKTYTLDIRSEYYQPLAFTDTDRPESHPAWLYDAGQATILVTVERDGASNIYRAGYGATAAEYRPLTSSPGFNGHPAGGPAWWAPDAAASLEWLKEHER